MGDVQVFMEASPSTALPTVRPRSPAGTTAAIKTLPGLYVACGGGFDGGWPSSEWMRSMRWVQGAAEFICGVVDGQFGLQAVQSRVSDEGG